MVILLIGALATLQALRPFLSSSGDGDGGFPLPQPEPCLGAAAEAAPPGIDATSVRGLARVVEGLRELRFEKVPRPTLLPSAEFERRVAGTIEYPEDEAERDARALAALGAAEPGTDLRGEVVELLEGQVAGFYDTDTKELVVRADGAADGLDAVERVTLAHELEHALADQALGLPDLDDPAPGREDASTATLALVEGDAQLVTELFVSVGLSLEEQVSLATSGASGAGLDEAPYYLARSLLFPYVEGAEFACALYERGGWEAVDRALADPPTTTAQVLFPSRYFAREAPVPPRAPDGLPAAWRATEPLAFGAADLLFLFEAPGGSPDRALDDPLGRAGTWAGGALHVWTRGADTATATLLSEREGGNEPRLCDSIVSWYRGSFPGAAAASPMPGEALAVDGERQDAVVRCGGGEVRLGTGPDLATARRAAA